MNNKIRAIKDVLWFLVFFAAVAGILRLVFGLGQTTNLLDQLPWGLWKVLNMIAGVALSTCGFTVGFLVYVLKIEKFKPLLRPAILVAFLGYGSSCFALLFDIGLPHRFWHPLVFWNIHSFLFEVFWCVMLYFTVTLIELSPNILEKFKAEKLVKFLHKVAIGVVIFGISLSSLHHSSLGSLFLTTPLRLHELWYSPLIPLMYIISAMGGGMMFLILVKIVYSWLYNPETIFGPAYLEKASMNCLIDNKIPRAKLVFGKEMPALSSLSIIASCLLGLYFIIKVYDLFSRNSFNALLAGTYESWLYAIEVLLTTVVPIIIVAFKELRRSPYWLGFAGFSASFGIVMNRVDVGIIGYFRDAQAVYIPSFVEWSLSIGVVAGAALAMMYISENFSIFDEIWRQQKEKRGRFSAAFDSFSRVWQNVLHNGLYRVTLISVFALPLAFILMYPSYRSLQNQDVKPAIGLDLERKVLLIDGNSKNESTVFHHADHQLRLGGEKSCIKCHHISMPGDFSTSCARCHKDMYEKTNIFDHTHHTEQVAITEKIGGLHPKNSSCGKCHTQGTAKTIDNATACTECHIKDMKIVDAKTISKKFNYANSYMDAMHKKCIPCHQQYEKLPGKSHLSDCSNCHKSMKKKNSIMAKSFSSK